MADERDIRPDQLLTGRLLRESIAGSRPTLGPGRGVAVTNGPGGRELTVSSAPAKQDTRPMLWYGEIVSSSASGSNRWLYRVRQVVKTTLGYGGWVTLSGGIDTGATESVQNLAEDQNAATGVQGNGVDVADLVGTFALQAIPNGTLVLVAGVTVHGASSTNFEWMIVGMPNGITGDCPTPQALTASDILADPYDDISDTVLQDWIESAVDQRLKAPAGKTSTAISTYTATNVMANTGVYIDATNNITGVTTMNGRSPTLDGNKLDTIETGAEVNDPGTEALAAGWNASLLESADIDVTSNGTTITLSLQAQGGGDLNCRFDNETHVLDCTPAATKTLTAGTDAVPVLSYVWLAESGGTVTIETGTAWPATAFCAVATVLCQSAASLQTDGPLKVHAWTDHVAGADQGHVHHLSRWIRRQPASWIDGCAAGDLVISSPDAYASIAAGTVYQLHTHTMPALDMQTGDPAYVVNDPTTAYKRITTLDDITQDASGGAINNRHFPLVLWGCVSEDEADCKLFWNLPTNTYVNAAQAEEDAEGYAVYAIPPDFVGTGFLIASYVVQGKTSGAWVQNAKLDLRGLRPSLSAGGAGGGVTDHGALSGLTDDDHTQYGRVLARRTSTLAVANTAAWTTVLTGSLPVQASGSTAVYEAVCKGLYRNNTGANATFSIRITIGGITLWEQSITAATDADWSVTQIEATLAMQASATVANMSGRITIGSQATWPTTGQGAFATSVMDAMIGADDTTVSGWDSAGKDFEIDWKWGAADVDASFEAETGYIRRI